MKDFIKLVFLPAIIMLCGCSLSSSEDRKATQTRSENTISSITTITGKPKIQQIEYRNFVSGGTLGQGWDLILLSGSAPPSALRKEPGASAKTPNLHAYRMTEKECELDVSCLLFQWLDHSAYVLGGAKLSTLWRTEQKVDFTQPLQNEEKLIIHLKALGEPKGFSENNDFSIGLGSRIDVGSGSFEDNNDFVDIGQLVAKLPPNEWVTVGVPLSCFNKDNYDVSDISNILLVGERPLRLMVEALSLGSDSDIESNCIG